MRSIKRTKTGLVKARFLWVLVLFFAATSIDRSWATSDPLDRHETVHSQQLERVQYLIRANALDLAQWILENQSPPDLPNPEWLAWERQLWALYRLRQDWTALYQRTRQIPPAFPSSIRYESEAMAITALIALNRGRDARKLLRQHLTSSDFSAADKKQHRRQVLESYLDDRLLDEVNIAMQTYQHDYRDQEEQWLILSANVYLQMGEVDRAVNSLAPIDSIDARLLRTYGRLRNGSLSPEQVIGRVETWLGDEAVKVNELNARAVLLAAYQAKDDHFALTEHLEQYLMVKNIQPHAKRHAAFSDYQIADLLSSYDTLVQHESDAAGLLGADEARWRAHASHLPTTGMTLRKAFYAYLIRITDKPLRKRQYINHYVRALIASEHAALIPQVFGENHLFGPLHIEPDTALILSNRALQQGDIPLAAQAIKNVIGFPEAMSEADWYLHVARILIIAGEYTAGAKRIRDWLGLHEQLQPEQTDLVLQPIFDLQTVKQHQLALKLLHRVNQQSSSTGHRREIAYWIAESYQATRQYLKAADYFLYSALQKGAGFDPWGESARFRAADSLMQANQFSDARRLFQDLLSRTEEQGRANVIRQKLQQLWLLESNRATTSSEYQRKEL